MTSLEITLSITVLILLLLLLNSGVRKVIDGFLHEKYPWRLTIFLAIGIVFYFIGYNIETSTTTNSTSIPEILRTFIIKFGDLFVLGVFLGIITNTARFLNIFRESIFSYLYSEQHLRQRKDIRELWELVSKSMFRDLYPEIGKNILTIIKDHYFPKSDQGYYDDYTVQYDIKLLDDNKKYIVSSETIKFIYKKFGSTKLFEQSTICKKSEKTDTITSLKVSSFKVDGDECVADLKQTPYDMNGVLRLDLEYELPKGREHKIEIRQEKVYKLDDDFDITFSSKRIANNVEAFMTYSADLYVYFQKHGTVNDYSVTSTKNQISAKYKGVILPKQGFTFMVRKLQ